VAANTIKKLKKIIIYIYIVIKKRETGIQALATAHPLKEAK
jgi:hypothetical protein